MTTKVAAIVGGSVIVVAIVAVLVVHAVLHAHSPEGVAESWAKARFTHNDDKAEKLQCQKHLDDSSDLMSLEVPATTSIKATDSVETGDDTWEVDLTAQPNDYDFKVTVIKEHGKYLVCDDE